jgi:hypothetical protein
MNRRIRRYMPWLHQATHAGITAENLAVPLRGHTDPLPGESCEICYVALGATADAMTRHLEHQRNSMPWQRRWICDPATPDAVKIIAFHFRSVAERAISVYSELGSPAIEVRKEDLPFLVEEIYDVLADKDGSILLTFGSQLGLVENWLGQHRYDETMRLLKDPKSAKDACWLLNLRDKLARRKIGVNIEELPWAIKLTDWDILPCKAVHPDGSAVYFQGEWKSMPLATFWARYCTGLMSPHIDLPGIWRIELMRADRINAQASEFVDDDDEADLTFIPEIDDSQL